MRKLKKIALRQEQHLKLNEQYFQTQCTCFQKHMVRQRLKFFVNILLFKNYENREKQKQ